MTYQIRLTERALRDLALIYQEIEASTSIHAFRWFNELARVILSLDQHPGRGTVIQARASIRQLLYGKRPHIYRIIYAIDEVGRTVDILHIRHGARDSLAPQDLR